MIPWRPGLAIGVATVVVCCAFVLVSGNRLSRAPASGSPNDSPGTTTDVASAVVNIDGDVTGGTVAGTGMIIGSTGIVLTNNHVVAGTTNLVAQVDGQGTVYRATVLGVDPTHDVAVIRLEGGAHLPTVPLETSGVVASGDDVTGMGNALGRNGSPVTATGVVTALDETLLVTGDGGRLQETLNGLIQFNAAIQPGDSGGPLLNAAGRVIGMDTAGSIPGKTADSGGNFGAAIPINAAITIANQIISGAGSPFIESGHSGILAIDVIDGADGAVVNSVVQGGGAGAAGIASGDVITAVGGAGVHSAADLNAIMLGRRPGDRVSVAWHDAAGAVHQATVTLSAGPPA